LVGLPVAFFVAMFLGRILLLRASLGFSLCPEKKEADDAAYDSDPYK
jgi:hypothetical protein